jgi:translin
MLGTSIGSIGNLDRIADRARGFMDEKNLSRERALSRSREVIRSSANTIRAVHRHDFERARLLLDEARTALREATNAVVSHGDVRFAGFIHDAQKEYAEASVVFAILSGQQLPGPEDIEVEWPAYLNGLAEAVGEMRRFLLDGLRRDDLSASEPLLTVMDGIYDVLVTMDYPDGITGGLRRTTDVARGILEKTRGDLTLAIRQRNLESRLQSLEDMIQTRDGTNSDPSSPEDIVNG